MCGIAGIVQLDGRPASPVTLRAMTDAIAHRGPDGEGHYIDGNVGLGHRRLAVIDLSPAGHQPMMTPDRRYVISYNGEVYNFATLRTELESLGHRFHSHTDSEVVLAAWAQWGPESVVRLNGMFAFAIWDCVERDLWLVRDRFGIKPLYVARRDGVVLFGSEVKAMLAHPALTAEPDLEGLAEYMTFQNFFTDRTLFKDVRLLGPGTITRVRGGSKSGSRGGNSTAVEPARTYWDLHFHEPTDPPSEAELEEELDHLLQQAVTRQLVSDVPVGAYLSGGMDSGAITAIAAKQLPYICSFTCGFDLTSVSGLEMHYDERKPAEMMSSLFRTTQYEMVLKSGDMERVLPSLTHHLEEPRVGQCYPNYYMAQLARKFVTVTLAGTGGDELFGGYPWRYYRAVSNDDFDHYIDKYYRFWQRLVSDEDLPRVMAPVWDQIKHVNTRDIFRGVFKEHAETLTRPEDYVNQSLYLEAKTFLQGLLVVEDKLSMAHGLETRVPFLDNDLVDFAMRLPTKHKLGNLGEVARLNENETGPKSAKFFNRTRDGKLLLRKAMSRHIPSEITDAVKQGFSAPDASWFKGQSIDYVRDRLYSPHARVYDVFDRKMIQGLVDDHLQGKENRRLLIWSLLNIEQWFDAFMGEG